MQKVTVTFTADGRAFVPVLYFGRYITGRPKVAAEIEALWDVLYHATNGQTIRGTAEEPAHEVFDVPLLDFVRAESAERLRDLILSSDDEGVDGFYWAGQGEWEVDRGEFRTLVEAEQ